MSLGQTGLAYEDLYNLESRYYLNESEEARYNDLYSLISLMIANQGIDPTVYDAETKSSIEAIANSTNNFYKIAAQSIVNRMNDTAYYGNVLLPETANQRKERPLNKASITKKNQLKAYPNPANDFVTVEFDLDDNLSGANLIIINKEGKVVYSNNISNSHNFMIINTSHLKSGLYNIILQNGNLRLKTITLTLIKE
jgi:hypothetical protein